MEAGEKQAVLEHFQEAHGYVLAEHGFLIDRDWEFFRRLRELYDYALTRRGALPSKMKEVCIIVALAVRLPGPEAERYLKNHIRQALKLGATAQEILEALECAIFPTGSPTLMVGVKCLREVLAEGASGGSQGHPAAEGKRR